MTETAPTTVSTVDVEASDSKEEEKKHDKPKDVDPTSTGFICLEEILNNEVPETKHHYNKISLVDSVTTPGGPLLPLPATSSYVSHDKSRVTPYPPLVQTRIPEYTQNWRIRKPFDLWASKYKDGLVPPIDLTGSYGSSTGSSRRSIIELLFRFVTKYVDTIIDAAVIYLPPDYTKLNAYQLLKLSSSAYQGELNERQVQHYTTKLVVKNGEEIEVKERIVKPREDRIFHMKLLAKKNIKLVVKRDREVLHTHKPSICTYPRCDVYTYPMYCDDKSCTGLSLCDLHLNLTRCSLCNRVIHYSGTAAINMEKDPDAKRDPACHPVECALLCKYQHPGAQNARMDYLNHQDKDLQPYFTKGYYAAGKWVLDGKVNCGVVLCTDCSNVSRMCYRFGGPKDRELPCKAWYQCEVCYIKHGCAACGNRWNPWYEVEEEANAIQSVIRANAVAATASASQPVPANVVAEASIDEGDNSDGVEDRFEGWGNDDNWPEDANEC